MNTWTGVLAFAVLQFLPANSVENDRPVIGILAQELDPELQRRFPGHKSYIVGSYVKAVEAAGAQVVPIMIGQTEQYYRYDK